MVGDQLNVIHDPGLLIISSKDLTYENRSPGIKALKASSWNTELASYAARFTFQREEVAFALSMRTVVTVDWLSFIGKYVNGRAISSPLPLLV
jgi:hypothetical protein